ncbi:MAG: bacteriohopanetetrol glucosamine biosynthesis glycosyltransferase HpnI [Acidobacteria bacterium]|nr:bacteriohopanetetrol glucosamine biosynthesis glycosyltransferase HpnI [Acidobacteriota bacterium]
MTLAPSSAAFDIFLLLAAASAFYYLAVFIAAVKFQYEKRAVTEFAPPVSVLKPLKGVERDLYDNLASHCRQQYPCFEIVVGFGDRDDPAHPIIAQLERDFPNVRIRTVIASQTHGANRKVNSLETMLREASFDVVVINDADIRVGPEYLRTVVAPLSDPTVGLVTCLYRGIPGRTVRSIFEALGISAEFAGQVLLARWVEGVKFALGATIATTKKQIAAIGGLSPLADYLADDYVLGNLIAAGGYRIHLSSTVVETVLPERSIQGWISQQLRWARTVRVCRPGGYLGLILTFGIIFAAVAIILRPHSGIALSLLFVTVSSRFLAAFGSGLVVCRDKTVAKFFWLLPIRDLVGFCIWVASFWGSQIVWRNKRFKLEKGGKMTPS